MTGPRRAFSLTELMIVILILGITAAIATPRLNEALANVKLHTAAIELATYIDYLRSVSVNESRTTTLSFDDKEDNYTSSDVDFPERPGERLHVSLPEKYDSGFQLRANFDTQTTLTFDFEGVPKVDGNEMESGAVTLRYGSDTFRVTIASGTGETTVQRMNEMTGMTENEATAEAP